MMEPTKIGPGAPGGPNPTPSTDAGSSPTTPTTPQPVTPRQLSSSLPLSARRASLDGATRQEPSQAGLPPRRQSLPTQGSPRADPSMLSLQPTSLPLAGNTLQSLATPPLPPSTTIAPTATSPTTSTQSLSEVAHPTTPPTDVTPAVPQPATQLALQIRQSRERLSSEAAQSTPTSPVTARSSHHDIEAMSLAHGPREASTAAFFAMQNLRHFGPVTLVRTAVQGSIAPELARAVASNPQAAIGVQAGLLAWSLARRILSQAHSESAPDAANRAFAGQGNQAANNVPRRAWQAVQSLGIAGGDIAALSLTALSTTRPGLQPVAQAATAIQLRAHMVSQLREFFRPTINTVHVGNRDSNVPQPPEGRNLRSEDVTPMMRLTFGAAAGAFEFGAQMLQQTVLGGRTAWDAHRGLAVAAGVIAGVANMLTSSVEDHLVDSASAQRMQQTDPSHVRHIHWESRNPLSPVELGRQAERVDARVFNMMVPALLAMGVVQALKPAMQAAGTSTGAQYAVQATVNAVAAAVLLGSLLALTVKTYQLNDSVRAARARPSGA
jgi:hypothetical protein